MVLQIGKIVHLSFRAHEKSAVHREAVDVMITLSSTTRDVGEQLSQEHAAQKVKNNHALLQIMSSIQFLSRQGLAMRSDGDKSDSKLHQLLSMKAEEDSTDNLDLKVACNEFVGQSEHRSSIFAKF